MSAARYPETDEDGFRAMTPTEPRPPEPVSTKAAEARERLRVMPLETFARGLEKLRCSSIMETRKKRLEQLNAQERS
jgi:hypothetical protein